MKDRVIYMEEHEKRSYEKKSKEILKRIEERITISEENIIEITENSELIENIRKVQ